MTEHLNVDVRGTTVRVVEDDLTTFDADVVVNAANRELRHGGGLAAALARAGGPEVQRQSDAWVAEHGPLTPDTAATTTAGALPARHLVHVAGPIYDPDADTNEDLLRRATAAALRAAAAANAQTVALPALSAGIFGYPLRGATAIIASEVCRLAPDLGITEVALVGFDAEAAGAFAEGVRAATA